MYLFSVLLCFRLQILIYILVVFSFALYNCIWLHSVIYVSSISYATINPFDQCNLLLSSVDNSCTLITNGLYYEQRVLIDM